jgi:multiple sugar transport system ATP-binding protein
MAELRLDHIHKRYGNQEAVKDFSLQIADKEFIVFLGPSGCGKSTTLRMIAGLEEFSEGNFYMDGKRMNDIPARDRSMAMVFQNYALYPHMTVYENMAFSLKLQKLSKSEIDHCIREKAAILGIEDCLNKKPWALSGGQRQRAALGRAIVRAAKVFLMDEPLSNLDAKLRSKMRTEIIKLHRHLQTTTIYVTHDQTEAMTMADRLVVIKDGVIQQAGSPKEIYDEPENIFVGSFIGSPGMNFFHGKLETGYFKLGNAAFSIPEEKWKQLNHYEGKEVVLGIRPEDIHEDPVPGQIHDPVLSAKIEIAELLGPETIAYLSFCSQSFAVRLDSETGFKQGDFLHFTFNMDKACFFDPSTEVRIRSASQKDVKE